MTHPVNKEGVRVTHAYKDEIILCDSDDTTVAHVDLEITRVRSDVVVTKSLKGRALIYTITLQRPKPTRSRPTPSPPNTLTDSHERTAWKQGHLAHRLEKPRVCRRQIITLGRAWCAGWDAAEVDAKVTT